MANTDAQQKELSNDRWSDELVDRIRQQRTESRHLCDVMVKCDVGDAAFPAHRSVLAASSQYFRALFANRLDADAVTDVTISASQLGVSRNVVEHVLDFMYSGKITLSITNLAEVLRLADFLCMSDLISLCTTYMRSVPLSTPQLCLLFLQLAETFHLSQVSDSLAAEIRQSVSRQLTEIFAALADIDDLPTFIVRQLITDQETGAVTEPQIYDAICKLASKRPDDITVLDLLYHVEFDYLGTLFVRQSVLTNVEVTGWLGQRRPEALAALRERVHRQMADRMVDVIVCGRRFSPVRGVSHAAARLLLYVIQDDEWVRFGSPATMDGSGSHMWEESRSSVLGSDWLGGLECLVTDGPWLYALCSAQGGAVSYVHAPVIIKHFCRLDLTNCGSHWQTLRSPAVVQSQCRLVVSVDGIYAIDQCGVVERYSASDDTWTVICSSGFPQLHVVTLYILPMLVGGDSQLCALRVCSSGVGPCCYASRSIVLYTLDHTERVWKTQQRSEIDVADLLHSGTSGEEHNTVNFHSYVATPGSVRLLDETAGERASYSFVASDWTSTVVPENSKPRPNFVGDILGSVPHAGRVYCACVGSADFVMYDVARHQYKTMCPPPDTPSGVMCHARVLRSSLVRAS